MGISNPELGKAEFKKNISQAGRPRLASEDDILLQRLLDPELDQKEKGHHTVSLFLLVERRGFEPLTPTLPVLCAPNCANAPPI